LRNLEWLCRPRGQPSTKIQLGVDMGTRAEARRI
jgi:hypothetical protein